MIVFGGAATIVDHHIVYDVYLDPSTTAIKPLMTVCYLLSILGAPFISSLRRIKML
ncbi:hypothetical protein KBC03_02170 [Patescibacteria group bacterium]|nr:hypothetical protein [Patescibacteria group bacterium]